MTNLTELANKYETKEFLIGDPSWFMHHIEGEVNKELLAFIASSISYGSRKQFIPKIQLLLDSINNDANGSVTDWLLSNYFSNTVPDDDCCFYRLYTNHTFHFFLLSLKEMIQEYGCIKQYLSSNMQGRDALEAITLITSWFREHTPQSTLSHSTVIPRDTSSSCKRICMFLRWMVRTDSPVDLGLWYDIIDRRTLIIPLDTHVIQEANRLGLLQSKAASMSSARKLTDKLKEIFPEDPLRGDFAMFGYGVSNT